MATMIQAIRMALHVGETKLGVTDIFGEDVGPPLGGVFTATQGLDTTWNTPLDEWPNEYIAQLPKGISRHLVRFANLGDYVVAVGGHRVKLVEVTSRDRRQRHSGGDEHRRGIVAVGLPGDLAVGYVDSEYDATARRGLVGIEHPQ